MRTCFTPIFLYHEDEYLLSVVWNPFGVVLLGAIVIVGSLGYITYSFYDVNGQSVNTTQGTSIEESATPVKEADAKTPSNFVINKDFTDPDNNCEFCTVMIYTPGVNEEAGIAYKDIKLDLDNSQRIVFFARSQNPTEQVSFVAAGNDTTLSTNNDTDIFPKIDFAIATENVTLKNKWERFEIALNSTELDDASYPFGVQLNGESNQKQTVYLKGVTIDSNAAQDPIPTVLDELNGTSAVTEALTANIDANSTDSHAPTTIQFGANATGGLAPYAYNWDFGEGSNSNNKTSVNANISHTFDKAGNYTVTLAAKDSGIPSQNASANIVVTIRPNVNETETVAEALTANIDANSTNSPTPATIEFGGNATGGSAPYSYSWNFGDGNNSTYFGPKISHTFDKAGNYTVTLGS